MTPNRGRWAGPPVLLGLALALAGCSPNRFATPVASFSTSVTQLLEAQEAGLAALRADHASLLRLQVADEAMPLELAISCRLRAMPDSGPCVAFPRRPVPAGQQQPQPALQPVEVVAHSHNARVAAQALRDYAAALVALTDGKDRAAYDAAAAKVQAEVKALAEKAVAISGGAAAPVALIPVATQPLFWLVGEALDAEREAMLRAAVAKAAPHVRTLGRELGVGLEAVRDARMVPLWAAANRLTDGVGRVAAEKPRTDRYAAATAMVETLNGVRQTDPRAAATALVTAHDRLQQALDDPAANAAAMAAAITELAHQARETRDALAKATQP